MQVPVVNRTTTLARFGDRLDNPSGQNFAGVPGWSGRPENRIKDLSLPTLAPCFTRKRSAPKQGPETRKGRSGWRCGLWRDPDQAEWVAQIKIMIRSNRIMISSRRLSMASGPTLLRVRPEGKPVPAWR